MVLQMALFHSFFKKYLFNLFNFLIFLSASGLSLFFFLIYLFIFGCVGSSFLCEGFL